ncbi:hypothetical protein KPH14_004330 [Odynerus spinipes]|uniref:Glutaredoxin domain-containing protein n=1 Tax=Odynerus spinipes TaxID=1348599 RepID=A0AAD9RZ85_9HYME|nr:hypothetical protein KPH14_004330 [Odynerus spinipes]
MAIVLCKLSRFSRGYKYLKNYDHFNISNHPSLFCTVAQQQKSRNLLKVSIISASIGVIVGTGYSFYKISEDRKNLALEGTRIDTKILKYKPPITPSRQVLFPVDTSGLKLTLYQYQTCPFCCKVRAFLDYYGISYDVVEVDPVLRREISWSSYTKVPILLVKVKNGYQPLNDSSMIISLLASYINDRSQNISELADYYPSIAMHDDKGKFKHEIMNKYFLMFNKLPPKDISLNSLVEERKWRQWADEVLVHTLSPNVYRTLSEAYETFNWFSEVGQWKEYFPVWEQTLIVNVGACAMWLIAKRLKKRHNLKDDVRQSLYDEVNNWLREVHANGTPFRGGHNPDLSDLAVYGILKSIEGCSAFKDLLEHTNVGTWYNAMKEKVDTYAGSVLLNI